MSACVCMSVCVTERNRGPVKESGTGREKEREWAVG